MLFTDSARKCLVCKAPVIEVNVSTPESSLFDDKKRDTTQEWNSSSKNRQEYLQVTLSKQNSGRHILEKLVDREKQQAEKYLASLGNVNSVRKCRAVLR